MATADQAERDLYARIRGSPTTHVTPPRADPHNLPERDEGRADSQTVMSCEVRKLNNATWSYFDDFRRVGAGPPGHLGIGRVQPWPDHEVVDAQLSWVLIHAEARQLCCLPHLYAFVVMQGLPP